MVKNQQPFYWYFVNKICIGKYSTECKNQDYLATIWNGCFGKKTTIIANLLYSYVLAEGGYVVAIKDLLTANIFESGPMPIP